MDWMFVSFFNEKAISPILLYGILEKLGTYSENPKHKKPESLDYSTFWSFNFQMVKNGS